MSSLPLPAGSGLSAEFCAEQATLYDLMADECVDARLRAEWRLMAQEWRITAAAPPAARLAPRRGVVPKAGAA